jgi:hypothetical protein
MAAYPGVIFRDGPAGRRPALSHGPDVAEVISLIRNLEESGDEAIAEAARWLDVSQPDVRAAVDYYVEFTDEVDGDIARRAEAADAAQAQWARRQRLLS